MNILIINLYSARNLGDDAIMYETLRGLHKAYPGAQITLAASDPDSWHKYHNVKITGSLTTWFARIDKGWWRARVLATPVYLFLLMLSILLYRLVGLMVLFGSDEKRRLLLAYYTADLVLSCGGGNFYAHKIISPFFLCSLLSLGLALGLGKRVVMLPQSVGPIKGHLQKTIARFLFNRVSWMLVRDQYSLDFADHVLRLKKQPVLMPDLAFAPMPLVAPLVDRQQAGLHIGVTVIDRAAQLRTFSGQEAYEKALVSVLIRLNQEYGANLYLFSQCNGPNLSHDDRRAVYRLYHQLKEREVTATILDTFDDALALKATYASMDCLIGSRMHTAIFGLSHAVPVVLISYQPKSLSLMKSFGLERYCCDIETVTPECLYEVVREVIENRESISCLIAERYDEIQTRLRDWTRYLK